MKNMNKLIFTATLTAAAAFSPAFAGDFPERPIELIVPFGAGGTTDIVARTFARVIDSYLPTEQRMVVINRPGGSSTIGMTAVANADPDGYTLGLLPTSVLELQPHYGRTTWTLDDFEPVLSFLEIPASINVLDSSPLKSYEDWLGFVQENPGEFTFTAAGGTGGSTHLSMELLASSLGVSIRYIPFEGESEAQSALLSGQIMGNYSLPDAHRGGEVRPLVFLSSVKLDHSAYDDTPTSADVGLDVFTTYPVGLVAPKGTPQERLDILHDAFKAAMDDPEIIKIFETTNLPRVYNGPEEFGAGMQQRSEENKMMLGQLGLI